MIKITRVQNLRKNKQIKESKRQSFLLQHFDLPNCNGWVKASVVLGRLRHSSPVILSNDIEAMIRTVYKFYKVQNSISLTGDILPKFLNAVCYD